jgi:uncharacterized protein GlcG (DUF336 family)
MASLTRNITRSVFSRTATFAISLIIPLLLESCGGVAGVLISSTPPPSNNLSAADVTALVQAAAQAADPNTMVIAVVDRAGRVLGVYRKPAAPTLVNGNFGAQVDASELAVSLARAGAFFSNDQAPLSSRTVRFISGVHFPPGIVNAPNAALYGIENSNRGCTLSTNYAAGKSVPPARSISGATTGLGIATGKADLNDSDANAVNPGGVPLFRNGSLVGGIGVAAVAPSIAEYAAYAAATSNGFGPTPAAPGVVFIDGVALPFVNQTSRPSGVGTGSFSVSLFVDGPSASPGPPPEGTLVTPVAGLLGGLSATDVSQIINNAVATANTTRAVIRLPIGSSARMAIAVSDLDGTIIGMYRMADSTVFSIDVAATKARNMVYFSSGARTAADLAGVPMGTAVTNRTIGYGAQPFFPPGIAGSSAGPFFNLYQQDVANPCTQGFAVAEPNQSGVVFFPGSLPLYRNGNLVGGLGVSGDGVDQDDFVAAGGAAGFEAPAAIRADQILVRGVRLPYLKFPTNPTN